MADGLATRCPACGTVFRVVPDQLRVSEGWVRCGRCANVFNASEALVDLDTGTPRRAADEATGRMVAAPISEPAPPAADDDLAPRSVAPGPVAAAQAPERQARQEPEEPQDRQEPESVPEPAEDRPSTQEESGIADRADPPFGDEPAPAPSAGGEALPSFVRRADRAARWKQPRVRAALLGATVLGALALAGQVGYETRDLLAARLPATRSALEQACRWLGCSVGAARSLEGLTVESSGLVRVEQSNIYRLTVALRNRSALELALPALDLSLTDSQGRLLARRVMHAAELGVNQATLAAGRDLALQATLQTGPDGVAGYTIELFYP